MEGHAATIRSRATRSQPAARFAHAGACAIDRSPRRGTGNSAGDVDPTAAGGCEERRGDRRNGRKVCCCVDASAAAMIPAGGPSVSCRPCTARREPDGGDGETEMRPGACSRIKEDRLGSTNAVVRSTFPSGDRYIFC